jgi:hypothetical protein
MMPSPSLRHLTKPAQVEPTHEQIRAAVIDMYDELDSLNGQSLYDPHVIALLDWYGIDHGRTPRTSGEAQSAASTPRESDPSGS